LNALRPSITSSLDDFELSFRYTDAYAHGLGLYGSGAEVAAMYRPGFGGCDDIILGAREDEAVSALVGC
jgi:hypothetical protein